MITKKYEIIQLRIYHRLLIGICNEYSTSTCLAQTLGKRVPFYLFSDSFKHGLTYSLRGPNPQHPAKSVIIYGKRKNLTTKSDFLHENRTNEAYSEPPNFECWFGNSKTVPPNMTYVDHGSQITKYFVHSPHVLLNFLNF